MTTVNELLVDESIRHQIQLLKYSNDSVRRMVAVLNRADAKLRAELLSVLERINPDQFRVERLESLIGSVRAMNAVAYGQLNEEITAELLEFTKYESAYQSQLLTNSTPVAVSVAALAPEEVYAAALARPFQGVMLKDVLKEMEATRAKRIRQKISQGFIEKRTTDQIVRDVFGTKKNGYADGLIEGSRREVKAVVRTALGHIGGFVQDRLAEANSDILKGVQWLATLDLRTSSTCRIRDHKLYTAVTHKPVGHSLPWLGGPGRAHWGCRSTQVFVVKSAAELELGIPDVQLQGGTRATMDGQIAKDVNYAEWIKKQSFTRQSDILGPTRAKLLKEGKLSLERMYSLNGQFLSLDQLRASDAAAFKRAGL